MGKMMVKKKGKKTGGLLLRRARKQQNTELNEKSIYWLFQIWEVVNGFLTKKG